MKKASNLLLVDSQHNNFALLNTLLDSEEYRLLRATGSEQAWEILEREHIDVLIADGMMPLQTISDHSFNSLALDNLALCREIRQDAALQHIPILLLTWREDYKLRSQALQAGVSDFINKPIDPIELQARLRTTTRFNRYRLLAEQSERLALAKLYDANTLLPNERYLLQRLPDELWYVRQCGQSLALIYIDLDGFQMIQNTLGNKTTEQIAQEMASRLRLLTDDDPDRQLIQIGYDRFSIIQKERCSVSQLSSLAHHIQQVVQTPVNMPDRELRLTASIGISLFPHDGHDSETLIAAAAMSMMLSRQQGRGNFRFVSHEMNQQLQERLNLEQELRRALESNELYLNFQPKVALDTGHVHSVEALVRWQHPQQGEVFPHRFISIAENSGLIVPLNNWVLHAACQQIKQWHNRGQTQLSIAVNISGWEFMRQDLVHTVQNTLAHYDLPGAALELELTESVLMTEIGKDQKKVINMLQALKDLGIKLSIDDFGTGYSSLSYLKQFPVDLLKIDQIFLRDVPADQDDAAIMKTIIKLAHSLRLQVIAEGVETPQQQLFLQQHGCDFGQGNLYSPALAAAELEQWWQSQFFKPMAHSGVSVLAQAPGAPQKVPSHQNVGALRPILPGSKR